MYLTRPVRIVQDPLKELRMRQKLKTFLPKGRRTTSEKTQDTVPLKG